MFQSLNITFSIVRLRLGYPVLRLLVWKTLLTEEIDWNVEWWSILYFILIMDHNIWLCLVGRFCSELLYPRVSNNYLCASHLTWKEGKRTFRLGCSPIIFWNIKNWVRLKYYSLVRLVANIDYFKISYSLRCFKNIKSVIYQVHAYRWSEYWQIEPVQQNNYSRSFSQMFSVSHFKHKITISLTVSTIAVLSWLYAIIWKYKMKRKTFLNITKLQSSFAPLPDSSSFARWKSE